jgi:hypothetical protein
MSDQSKDHANDRDVFAMARDASLLFLVFLYIVGFSYRSAYLSALKFGTEFSVDSVFDLLHWAEQLALRNLWSFVALLTPLALVFCFASSMKRSRVGKGPHGEMICTAAIGLALAISYGGGLLMATCFGASQGRAAADLEHRPGEALEEVAFQRKSSTIVESDCAPISSNLASAAHHAPKRQYYIVDETRDHYEMVSRMPAERTPTLTAMAVRKDDVLCYAVLPETDTPARDQATPQPATTGAPHREPPPGLGTNRVAAR